MEDDKPKRCPYTYDVCWLMTIKGKGICKGCKYENIQYNKISSVSINPDLTEFYNFDIEEIPKNANPERNENMMNAIDEARECLYTQIETREKKGFLQRILSKFCRW